MTRLAYMTGEMALTVPGVRKPLAFWWGCGSPAHLTDMHVQGMFATLCVDEHERVIGLHFYQVVGRSLDSKLTWVMRKHRRQGIGRRMWKASLRFTGAKKVWAYAASDEGAKFVRALSGLRSVKTRFDTSAWEGP